jgi:hypothetical protein
VEAVLADEADIGIMSYPLADRSLTIVPLQDEPMGFVCHPSHRLARRRLVMPADLAGEPFVAFDAGLTIRKAIDRALRQANVRLNIVMEFDNIETIKQAISIAAGVSILPLHTVEKEASIGMLVAVRLGIPDLVRPVAIIHRRQKPLTPTASRFILPRLPADPEGRIPGPPLRPPNALAGSDDDALQSGRTAEGRAGVTGGEGAAEETWLGLPTFAGRRLQLLPRRGDARSSGRGRVPGEGEPGSHGWLGGRASRRES